VSGLRNGGALALCVGLFVLSARAAGAQEASGAPAAGGRIVIGSKNFSESHLLGEVLRLFLEAHTELEVEHESGLGGTLVCFTALRTGGIDLYPEYTGTGWAVLLEEEGRSGGQLEAFLTVRSRFRERFDVEWLAPLGFENTYALAMPEGRAAELDIRSISDLCAHGGSLRGAFSHEFLNRADGYPGLASHYGLELESVRGMEHALAYEAAASGEIDVLDAYSTDGKLRRFRLRVLEDDRGFFPPYDAALLVRGALLRERLELGPLLERLSFSLTAERMGELNHAVEVERRSMEEVARGFLVEAGLLGTGGASAADRGTADGDGGLWRFVLARAPVTARLAWEHLQLTLLSVLLAGIVAVPLGVWMDRRPLARRLLLGGAGVLQTIPSLALLAFLIAVPGLGLSVRSAIVALFLYAVLPILRNTHAGLAGVAPELVDAARGLGLSPRQVLARVQLPLATETILAGVRTATVISVGVATLAAFIGAGGLGEPIVTGLYLHDTRLILAGALPAAALALLCDHLLGRLERLLVPRGLRLAAEGTRTP